MSAYGDTGTIVKYTASNGKTKVGLVVGDPETVGLGSLSGTVEALEGTQRTLMVFSPAGTVYLRQAIPARANDDDRNVWF